MYLQRFLNFKSLLGVQLCVMTKTADFVQKLIFEIRKHKEKQILTITISKIDRQISTTKTPCHYVVSFPFFWYLIHHQLTTIIVQHNINNTLFSTFFFFFAEMRTTRRLVILITNFSFIFNRQKNIILLSSNNGTYKIYRVV